MGQWIVILALALVGQFVSDLISFPIPKTIIASIILFLLLEFKVVKADYFKEALASCKKHLAFLFLPVGVGIMTQLKSEPAMVYVKVLIIMIISTILIMLVTGVLADIIIGAQEKILGDKDKKEGKNEWYNTKNSF